MKWVKESLYREKVHNVHLYTLIKQMQIYIVHPLKTDKLWNVYIYIFIK